MRAEEQVGLQKAKIYTIKIEGKENINQAFNELRRELGTDLERLRKEVIRPVKDIMREVYQSFKIIAKPENQQQTNPVDNE